MKTLAPLFPNDVCVIDGFFNVWDHGGKYYLGGFHLTREGSNAAQHGAAPGEARCVYRIRVVFKPASYAMSEGVPA